MASPDWKGALAAWRAVLGAADAVLERAEDVGPYRRNTGGLEREIPCVLRPASVEEVQAVVRIANRFGTPLYPISRGRNWGMGSRLPVRSGGAIVDLSRMTRIRAIDVPYHYAVVEAGVTQGQLFDRLRAEALPLWLNVTGSGRETSLVGNALDRGVGYFRARADALSGLEVVLGTGEIAQLGFGAADGGRARYLYRPGLGPCPDGLFSQSGFGIVTAAGVDLLPAPPAHAAFVARVGREEDLAPLLDRLVALRRDEVFQTVAHIGNRERSRITMAPLLYDQFRAQGLADAAARAAAEDLLVHAGFGAWSAVGGLLGPPGHLRSARREIARALRGLARVTFLTDRLLSAAAWAGRAAGAVPAIRRQTMLLEAVRPLYGFTRGEPTDVALKGVFWPVPGAYPPTDALDPDQSNAGLLYFLPLVPADGSTAAEVLGEAHERLRADGFEPATTLNLMDTRTFEGVMSIAFNRADPGAVGRAQSAMRAVQQRFLERGLLPTRAGLDTMDLFVRPGDPHWELVDRLKRVCDPNNILAPGRYSLL